MVRAAVVASLVALTAAEYQSEFKETATVFEKHTKPLPHTYLNGDSLPDTYSWADVDGVSYLTKNLNQHIPQYCGSCWAHGALSALADRIKIAQGGKGIDINLSIQYILNCGTAGSCYGGSATSTYEYISNSGHVPYDTCQPYLACSSDSSMGFCSSVDTTCSASTAAMNTCRTCSTFGVDCAPIAQYPNASIAEYGTVDGETEMMAEIFARGPIAVGVDAEPLLEYTGGVFSYSGSSSVNHIVSIYGWGVDENGVKYWNVRNSWGEYWGEQGHFRIERGVNALQIESMGSWATLDAYTTQNFPCYEDGSNCGPSTETPKDASDNKFVHVSQAAFEAALL